MATTISGFILFGTILVAVDCGGSRAGRIDKIIEGLSLVCVTERPTGDDCVRGKVPVNSLIQAHRYHVYDLPNTEPFKRSWELFEKRIHAEGFEIVEHPGPGPRGFHSIYVGGPLYSIKFRGQKGVYTLSTTIVGNVKRTGSEFSDWRPENLVLATP